MLCTAALMQRKLSEPSTFTQRNTDMKWSESNGKKERTSIWMEKCTATIN